MDSNLIVFDNQNIRRVLFNDEWFYSIVDIIEVLTSSPQPRKYWNQLKLRKNLNFQLSPIWRQLKLISKDGKLRKTDCVNSKGIFKLVEFIPSSKVEEFKRHIYEIGLLKINEDD